MQLCRTKFRKSFILSTKKWIKGFPWKNPVNARGLGKSGDITRCVPKPSRLSLGKGRPTFPRRGKAHFPQERRFPWRTLLLCVPEPSGLSRSRGQRQTLRESGFAPGGSEHNSNCGARSVPARLDPSQMPAPGTCSCGAFGHNGSAAAGIVGQEWARRTICSGYCHSVLES